MAPLSLRLKITPQTLAPTALRPFSSSPLPDQNPSFNGENGENRPSPKSSLSSLFSNIKERLRSPPSPPLRIPCDPPPPSIASSIPNPATSFKEIRKNLDGFRLRSSPSMPSRNPNPPPKTVPPPSKRSATTGSASDPPSMPSRNPNPPPKTVPPPSKRSATTGSASDPPSMPSRNPNPLSQDVPTSFEEIRKYLGGLNLRRDPESILPIFEREEILRTPVVKLDDYDELREELRMLKRSTRSHMREHLRRIKDAENARKSSDDVYAGSDDDMP